MAHPRGFEPLTARFVAEYSIQLSYGCPEQMAVREGFEPSMEFLTPYSLSRGAPSAYSAISPQSVCGRYDTNRPVISQIIFSKSRLSCMIYLQPNHKTDLAAQNRPQISNMSFCRRLLMRLA